MEYTFIYSELNQGRPERRYCISE